MVTLILNQYRLCRSQRSIFKAVTRIAANL